MPSSATGTNSLSGSAVTGSYSTGGTCTRPSLPRMPSMRRSRSAFTKRPSTGPVERV